MASISKLSIRGVRSFSPDDAEQVLEFYFPCTIIVGANGCGKTTIIESLKFAVSGSMPPGNKSGQAFVHDPRSIGQSLVKAQVKLRFTGRAGTSMVVARSMEVQQKKTTLTFKQLDGVLRSTDENGKRVSIGHKCSELDRQLPMLLGVSKAILEHVVFCHQEESSWPLQEGAVLKKRFDDIFDSTRYSKALEVFAKLKKDYSSQVKDLKADVAGISSHRHAAKGFRQELSQHNEQMEVVEEEITDQKDALKETEEEQKKLESIMERVDELNGDLETRRQLMATKKEVLKNTLNMLQEDLTNRHSLSELKGMQLEFASKIDTQREEENSLEAELKSARDELDRIHEKEAKLKQELIRAETLKEQHMERLKARYEKMVAIGNEYALGDVVTQSQLSQTQTSFDQSGTDNNKSVLGQDPLLDISAKDLEEFDRAMDRKENDLREDLRLQKAQARKDDDELGAEIARLGAQMHSIEENRALLRKKEERARKEMAEISDQMKRLGPRVRKSDLEEARHQSIRLAKERDLANADPRKSEIALEVRDMESKVDALKRDLEDDRMALKSLRQTSDAQNAIVVLKGQCSKDLEILEETIRESSYLGQQFNISSFPKGLPGAEDSDGEQLLNSVQKAVSEIEDKLGACKLDMERARTDVSKYQSALSERNALISHERRSVQTKRARMTRLEESVDAVKGVVEQLRAYEMQNSISTPENDTDEAHPEQLLAYISGRLMESETESMEGIGSDVVKKLISKLLQKSQASAEKFICPCCTREFTEEKEFKVFKKQMKILKGEASPLLKVDERSRNAQANYIKWKDTVSEHSQAVLEYRRIANEVHDAGATVRQLEIELSDFSGQLNDAKDTLSDLEKETASLQDLFDSAKRWYEAAGRIVEKWSQIRQKTNDLSISTVDAHGRDLETVEREMNERIEEREHYNNQMARLNKELTALMSRISQLSDTASKSEENFRRKEKQFADDEEFKRRKDALGETILNCATEDKKLQEQLSPIVQKLRLREADRQKMRKSNEETEQGKACILDLFLSSAKELREIGKKIADYEASCNENDLASFAQKSAGLSKQANDTKDQIETILPKYETVRKALENQERYRKNLRDNIDVISLNQQIEETRKGNVALEEMVAQVDGHETVDDDMENLRSRRESILKMVSRLEGRRGEILESIRSVKRKLSAPEYKDVDEEYRVAMIKYETTQMAVKDLEKYHVALDKALLKFHSLKIAEINTIIRDLWNLTYKGQDISSIEIVSGQESGSRATRSYNYRVVMTKGSTQLDMRGRCSAGQRVLASIVIRLALAETFCLNFGCIALDEPTVNLDEANKKGLATALAQIIASRAQQSNFQLVLITHDEDFVSMMKTELSSQSGFQLPEKYFQVRREEGADGKFYSKIDAIDWDELI